MDIVREVAILQVLVLHTMGETLVRAVRRVLLYEVVLVATFVHLRAVHLVDHIIIRGHVLRPLLRE